VYDPKADQRPTVDIEGISTASGWFPLENTDIPTAEQLGKLQAAMGGQDAESALKPPVDWVPCKDPNVAEVLPVTAAEKQAVTNAFMKTLTPNIKVVSVERIQNMSMWQTYAVKRQTVLTREGKGAKSQRFERAWLFHGTDETTVPKIMQQGFNRSFCGKNATMYGKGVYFARDASYSSSAQYSRPDAKGIQYMFASRVVVGEYCLGKRDAPAPDVRKGHQLYDSTVNDTNSPGIFVTYHDAQAYPEYLVKFRQ